MIGLWIDNEIVPRLRRTATRRGAPKLRAGWGLARRGMFVNDETAQRAQRMDEKRIKELREMADSRRLFFRESGDGLDECLDEIELLQALLAAMRCQHRMDVEQLVRLREKIERMEALRGEGK